MQFGQKDITEMIIDSLYTEVYTRLKGSDCDPFGKFPSLAGCYSVVFHRCDVADFYGEEATSAM